MKKIEKLLFIKEVDGDNIKVKEAEWGRSVAESDIPSCFSYIDDRDPECVACIIRVSCGLWKEKNEAEKREIFDEKREEQELKEQKGELEMEDKLENSTVKDQEEEVSETGVTTESSVILEEGLEKNLDQKEITQMEIEKSDVKEETKKDDSSESDHRNVKRMPKGYIQQKVTEMLKRGTTRAEIKAFTDELGYGESGAMLVVRTAKKQGKLGEDVEKGVKLKDRKIYLIDSENSSGFESKESE